MIPSTRDILVLCFCAIVHFTYRYRRRRLLPFPPGPFRWPLVGSAFSMSLNYAHVSYKDLGKKLGTKLLYFEALGRPIMVINDARIAQELLEKRSALYSSRPQLVIFTDVIGIRELFGAMPYGDEWRIHRRMFQQYFSARNIHQQQQIQERALEFIRRGLLPNLCTSPKDFYEHLRSCIGGLSTSITYGLPVRRQHDSLIRRAEQVFADMTAAGAPGKYLVNIISSLQYIPEWMPGGGFKTAARDLRLQKDQLMEEPYQATLKTLECGTAQESFVAASLERHRDTKNFETRASRVKQIAMQVFGAVSETTSAVAMTFVLMMLKHPDIQRRAQHEIDSVIDPDRLPTLPDIQHLPYLSAIVKETLRWNPVVPMGIPHMTTDEDVYEGYYIPKDCIVIANIYAMLRDEDIFPDPSDYKPERFLKNGVLRDDVPDPEVVPTFGFGRRICPGSHIALPFLYVMAASILHLFDISPELDAAGNPIDVVPKFTPSSLASEPLPFPCKITRRKDRDVEGLLKEYLDSEFI